MFTMKTKRFHHYLILVVVVLLAGCSASQMAGFENAYQGYNVPEPLVEQIRIAFKKHGLPSAQVARDNVGRIRLVGSYRDEDEVDLAFVIVQSIVGIKSTSPFYPENIKQKRWEADAIRMMAQFTKAKGVALGKGTKRALIVGLNTFNDHRLTPILGEDDANRVKFEAEKAGYRTTVLLGKQATKANVESAIEQMKRELSPADSLLIYISSHGNKPFPSPRAKDARKMSIAVYDTGDPTIQGVGTSFQVKVHETSVSDTKVQELARMPTRQTRIIIDTCYSGEILKGVPDESSRYILHTNGGIPERAGVSIAAWTQGYAAKGIFSTEDQVDPPAQVRGRNAPEPLRSQKAEQNRYTIITATSDGQLSWGPKSGDSFESPVTQGKRLQGSFFTQAFFDYLEKHQGQLEPAFRDAKIFTYGKVAGIPPEKVSWRGPTPIPQVPRMEPSLPVGDGTKIYD